METSVISLPLTILNPRVRILEFLRCHSTVYLSPKLMKSLPIESLHSDLSEKKIQYVSDSSEFDFVSSWFEAYEIIENRCI